MLNIPIIVVAFERPESLKRILKSLEKAIIRDRVELIISIDKSDNPEVSQIAEDFEWQFGEKIVINHTTNLGLREHIMQCGDLVKDYDGVILLEDDLYVSPYFYEYSQRAVEYYKKDSRIAGISLFSHNFNETQYLPFIPFPDNSDIYFMQLPSSWGQCWTRNQWNLFKRWYTSGEESFKQVEKRLVPQDVINWKDNSWKKYFFYYVIDLNKFFVYPTLSLSTNFSDPGTHMVSKKQIFQVPLQFDKIDYKFKTLDESICVYDAFCEMLPDRLKKLSPDFLDYDLEIDLFGVKPLNRIHKEYLLSTKSTESPISHYGREMKPAELNVIEKIKGNEIFLGKTSSFKPKQFRKYTIKDLLYYYNMADYLHIKSIIVEWNERIKLRAAKKTDVTNPDIQDQPVKINKLNVFFLRLINLIKIHKFRFPFVVISEVIKRFKK